MTLMWHSFILRIRKLLLRKAELSICYASPNRTTVASVYWS